MEKSLEKNPDVFLYDTTLRDGTQGEEVSFTAQEKLIIAQKLETLGIHYIEAGWPGSNPKDLDFFNLAKKQKFKQSKITAFGSTRKAKISPEKDTNLQSLIQAETAVVTIFGKSWDLHVRDALKISLRENIELIGSSIHYLKKNTDEVIYDAEHFFDGFKANPEYALETILEAEKEGASWIVLCDTNGGTLPEEIEQILLKVRERVNARIGIHCHNDGELAVANSLSAIRAGAKQVHGTINGVGERCGNANLISVIPNLQLKMGLKVVKSEQLSKLTEVAHFVAEVANMRSSTHQPFVGKSAFAHKGGVHVNAVGKNPKTYEHIEPEQVGNQRRILVSDLSGVSNIRLKAEEYGIDLNGKETVIKEILSQLKELENKGFLFEGAEASFEILMRRALGEYRPFFKLIGFRIMDQSLAEKGGIFSEAIVQLKVDEEQELVAAQGDGPVNALDLALRKALERFYPVVKKIRLIDYKVRVLSSGIGTASSVRVLISSTDGKEIWNTVGLSENIIHASWMALVDSLEFKLFKEVENRKRK